MTRCPESATHEHWWLKLLTGGRKCYHCGEVEKMTDEELKEIMEGAIARAELEGPQLAELYDLSKTELFSKRGGEIVREVIEARQ